MATPPTSQSQPLGGAAQQELNTTPAGNLISELTGGDLRSDTPTFGLLQPRGATHTWRLPNQGCALRLDFSSPSLSVLSPFVLSGANSGVGGGGVAATPGVGGNEREKEKQENNIKEENNQNESPALNPEKAALTRKRVSYTVNENLPQFSSVSKLCLQILFIFPRPPLRLSWPVRRTP